MADEKRKLVDDRLYHYIGRGHQLGLKMGDVMRYYGQHLTGPHEVFLRNGLLAHVSIEDFGAEVAGWDDAPAAQPVATIHTFKESGKWYATGRGVVTREVYIETHEPEARRAAILALNGGVCPGLSGTGPSFVWIVLPDESVDFGFPLLLRP